MTWVFIDPFVTDSSVVSAPAAAVTVVNVKDNESSTVDRPSREPALTRAPQNRTENSVQSSASLCARVCE